MKTFLLISRHSPYGSSYAGEALDIALSAAAFDIQVSVLFMDDGVYQLTRDQQVAPGAAIKHLAAPLGALPLYDIQDLWVERESLDCRQIRAETLAQPAKLIASAKIADFTNRFDRVLTI